MINIYIYIYIYILRDSRSLIVSQWYDEEKINDISIDRNTKLLMSEYEILIWAWKLSDTFQELIVQIIIIFDIGYII